LRIRLINKTQKNSSQKLLKMQFLMLIIWYRANVFLRRTYAKKEKVTVMGGTDLCQQFPLLQDNGKRARIMPPHPGDSAGHQD
jgi:hypothetical protein